MLQPKHAPIQTWCIRSAGTLALIPAPILTEDMCVKNTASTAVSAPQVSNCGNFSSRVNEQIMPRRQIHCINRVAGLVLDDLTGRGCIAQDQCSCTHNGKIYHAGQNFTSNCKEW